MLLDRNLFAIKGIKPVMAALVLLALLSAATTAGQAIFLASAIAGLWAGAPFDDQIPFIAAFFSCFFLGRLFAFAQDTMLDSFSTRVVCDMHEQILARIFDAESMLASRMGAGSVATTATEGMQEIQTYLRVMPPKAIGIIAIALPLLIVEFVFDWVSGVILLVLFPVIVGFMILLGNQARTRAERQYATYHVLSNRFVDTLRGLDAIVAAGAGDIEAGNVFRFSEKLRRATVSTMSTATLSSVVLDLAATFGVAAVAMMLAFRLMDGSIDLATGLTCLMIAPEYFNPIRSFASDFHASLDGKNALAAYLEMAACTGKTRDFSTSLGLANGKDAVVFDNVSFTYEDSGTPAVHDISCSVTPGQHLLVLGESGAGKSTFAALAAGFIKPDTGSVHANGTLHFIPQNPYIFHDTLANNVRFYHPEASDDDVLRVISVVGLDNLVYELPEGIHSTIGQGARGLSGGQAHRIALARVLLDENTQILVFDEPTAHLDIETELELKRRLLPLMEGKTVIFATHRTHWLDAMDRVVVLDHGFISSDLTSDKFVSQHASSHEASRSNVGGGA